MKINHLIQTVMHKTFEQIAKKIYIFFYIKPALGQDMVECFPAKNLFHIHHLLSAQNNLGTLQINIRKIPFCSCLDI